MDPDERAIRDLHDAWIAAASDGDLARLLSLMTDDAVFLNPGRAPLGQAEFRAVFTAAHRESRIRCVSDVQEIVIGGDMAVSVCRDTLAVTPRHGGPTAQLTGHRMTVYRRQPDGRWLLARDANTVSPVAG